MRKSFVALLLLLGATALTANIAAAYDEVGMGDLTPMVRSAQMSHELQSRANRLGTSAGIDDTTWVGYTPGFFNASNNYWSIYAGSGKDGFMRPINGQPDKGNWNWDAPVNGDSLQGWWPIRILSSEGGTAGNSDRLRPHTCISFGNVANYVINQGRGANWQQRANGTESGWRTFGVDGVWHVDAGNTVTVPNVPAPTWSPIAGDFSAWMGMRAHADNTHIDPLTGNPFNQNVMSITGGNPTQPGFTDVKFPGYGGAMDQMLYRDIDFAGKTSSDLTVSFKYRTNLSTGALSVTRFGWYNHDPLSTTCGATNPQPNNFISGMDAGATNAPRDSFMVYIGSGVDGNQWTGSDGLLYDVYDPKHRWFAEVLHADFDPGSDPDNPMPLYYKELLSVAGQTGTETDLGTPASFVIPNATLAPFLAKNNKIRLVFRVKTNMFFDDETIGRGFSSNGWGAVQVDDVTYQIGANPVVNFGDFEATSDINNDPAVSALDAWKSTGKPPAIYHHVEQYDNVLYEDLCGPKGAARICDLQHGILSMGNHDDNERAGGNIPCTSEFDWRDEALSPTIQIVDDDGNPNTKNPHGLYGIGGNGGVGDIVGTEDYYIREDVYTGTLGGSLGNRNYWRFAMQSYPCEPVGAPLGYQTWGHIQRTGFIFYEPTGKLCYGNLYGAAAFGLIATTNGNGIPDSLKLALEYLQLCYAFNVTAGCGSTDGSYRDNAALAIVDGTPSVISVDIWDWFQDTFPANENPSFPGDAAAFDTTAALIKIGRNIHPRTGDVFRPNIPGDSIWVQSASGTPRMDMVFRVLPGPGNYQPVGDGHTGDLRKLPNNPATVVPFDGSWWDVYRRIPGEYSTNPLGMTGLKAGWNPHFWVSARCDTAEANLYALQGRGVLGGPGSNNDWMSTYHESDPRYGLLGVVKNKCFVSCETCNLDDIKCDGTLPVPDYTGGAAVTTIEGTKIIPDGLLTPGSHVQYFFRSGLGGAMIPDTNQVSPQISEGPSSDGHRWQQFGVLPDRWKDPSYLHPVFQTLGRGPACLLVVDWNDRRGNEQRWVGVADTIGATEPQKFGAHNGWHAAGTASVNDPAGFVAQHGGQPGTTWDLYQVKGSESSDASSGSLGSRLAYTDPGNPLMANKTSKAGPTPDMLRAYYTLLLLFTGDLGTSQISPFPNRSDDDCKIIRDWLAEGDIENQNRGIWGFGDGFVEAMTINALSTDQTDLITNYFYTDLVDIDFQHFSGVNDAVVDIRIFPEWQGKDVAQIYGLRNACLWTTDVLKTATPLLTAVAGQYEQKGAPVGGFSSSIFKDWDPSSPWKALVSGWDIDNMTTRNDVTTAGRSLYMYKIFTNVWAKIWPVAGTPIVPLDVPTFDDGGLVNFVNVAGNPMYASLKATIKLGLARADRVQIVVYDVAGRAVRELADRNFPAGTHDVVWDGLDNSGRQVARGVYFTQVKFANQKFQTARKLTVLK